MFPYGGLSRTIPQGTNHLTFSLSSIPIRQRQTYLLSTSYFRNLYPYKNHTNYSLPMCQGTCRLPLRVQRSYTIHLHNIHIYRRPIPYHRHHSRPRSTTTTKQAITLPKHLHILWHHLLNRHTNHMLSYSACNTYSNQKQRFYTSLMYILNPTTNIRPFRPFRSPTLSIGTPSQPHATKLCYTRRYTSNLCILLRYDFPTSNGRSRPRYRTTTKGPISFSTTTTL